MKIIGITGGIGSGKSAVLDYIKEKKDTVVCQADIIAHELEEPGEVCYAKIAAHFGPEVLNDDEMKTINRKALGTIVFQDTKELKVLNGIVHPAVKDRISELIRMAEKKDKTYFVVEAALLLEEHYEQICDELWYVYADEKVRRYRLRDNRHYSDEKITSIMMNQKSDEDFRKTCQVMIDNSGELKDTYDQVDALLIERRM